MHSLNVVRAALLAIIVALASAPIAQAIDVRVQVTVPKHDSGRQVSIRVSGLDCTVAQQRVRFSITSRGVTHNKSDVPCAYDWSDPGNLTLFDMRRLGLETYFSTNLSPVKDTAVGQAEVVLTPHDRTGVHIVRWRIYLDDALLRSGGIRWRTTYTPGRRIWQGTDAFVNYCINNLKKLRSENLTLYCIKPSEISRRAALLP